MEIDLTSPSTRSKTVDLETLAIESCLSVSESTLQGMTLGSILSSPKREHSEILHSLEQKLVAEVINRNSLDDFVALNLSMLKSESLDFQLLIGEDESPPHRLNELTEWLIGFLDTFDRDEEVDEVGEVIEDFVAISSVDTSLVSDGEEKPLNVDQMVEECVEHVRVGIMLLNELK